MRRHHHRYRIYDVALHRLAGVHKRELRYGSPIRRADRLRPISDGGLYVAGAREQEVFESLTEIELYPE